MNMLPVGSGMYIWKLNKERIAKPSIAAEQAVKAGFKWVTIKFQSGRIVSDGDSVNTFNAKNPDDYVKAFRDAGISVHGWGYIFGRSTEQAHAEVMATMSAIERFNPDSWCINAELEYKKGQTSPEIAQYYVSSVSKELRKISLPLGFTTYRFPTVHPEFNWEPFFKYCDYASPQVYWLNAYNAGEQLRRTIKEYRARTAMPIIPIGCAFPYDAWTPNVAEMDDFYNTVVQMQCPGFSWWEWYYAFANQSWWNAISKYGAASNIPNSGTENNADILTRISVIEKQINDFEKRIKALEVK